MIVKKHKAKAAPLVDRLAHVCTLHLKTDHAVQTCAVQTCGSWHGRHVNVNQRHNPILYAATTTHGVTLVVNTVLTLYFMPNAEIKYLIGAVG